MNNYSRFAAVAAIATVAATGISTTASANPFEALFGPHREPITTPA